MTPEELKAWREQRRLTQEALGELLGGIPNSTISKWELGQRRPPPYLSQALETLDRRLKKTTRKTTGQHAGHTGR